MTELASHMTRGEILVKSLLEKLSPREYFHKYEPRLIVERPNSSSGVINSKPDFVVVSARYGVIILEVKDWVKIADANPEYTDIVRSDGTPMRLDNPYNVAERYAYDLKARFETRVELWEQYKGRTRLKFPWQVMVGLTRISQNVIKRYEDKGSWIPRTFAGKEVFTSPSTLKAFFDNLPWLFRLERPLNGDMLDIIREILDPSLVVLDEDQRPIGTLTRQQEATIYRSLQSNPNQLPLFSNDDETTAEANAVVENYEVRLIRGVAGSGKTLVLIRRVLYLMEQYPEAHILVTAFNVNLIEQIKKRLGETIEKVTVTNFHKICSQVLGLGRQDILQAPDWLVKYAKKELQALNLTAEFVADEFEWRMENNLLDDAAYLRAERLGRSYALNESRREIINAIFTHYRQYKSQNRRFDWADIPFMTIEKLQNPDHPMRHQYDIILIDEWQDFAPSWMRVLKLLMKPTGHFFVCADDTQSIVRKYSPKEKGLAVVGRTVNLSVPFRSTRRVFEAAYRLIEADPILRESAERVEPNFTSYELMDGVIPSLIACLDAQAESNFIEAKIHDLCEAGAEVSQIVILCRDSQSRSLWTDKGVSAFTFRTMKGLEFPVVFIPNLNTLFHDADDAEKIAAVRRKLFTAMTRSRYRLFMTYTGTLPEPLTPLLDYVASEMYPAI